MTKEQKIQEAYGGHWEKLKQYVKDTGTLIDPLTSDYVDMYISINRNDLECIYTDAWRPKLLSGLEDNNGWIKIDREEDLPKDSSAYWIYRTDNRISNLNDYETDKKWLLPDLKATHYQPIEKPNPPIY